MAAHSLTAELLKPATLRTIALIGSVCMALFVILIRTRAAKKPANAMKIIMPPLGMSTGFLMFLFPATHIPLSYAFAALLVGSLFSIPLIRRSKFEQRDGSIYLQRSKSFAFLLLGLLALRIALHQYVEQYVTFVQTGAVFFILAFGMILPWRVAMYRRYAALRSQ